MRRTHKSEARGLAAVAQAPLHEGRFGRMFRRLPTFQQDPGELEGLAQRMREVDGQPQENPSIPAGYTYFGQFVDHDITFDPASSLERANDPDALVNFRTPRFDLDSLYGRGPADEPFLYERANEVRLLLGKGRDANGQATTDDDLPRNEEGVALIGDPRNDENIIVSQLQLLFIKFHNRVTELIQSQQPDLTGPALLKEVQRVVRWHYQWVVVHDYLVRIAGEDTVNSILGPIDADQPALGQRVRTRFFRPKRDPYMPVEFAVAAYRFGHSMVRPTYRINETVPELPIFSPDPNAGPLDAFHGRRPLPAQWTVDWSFFFDMTGAGSAKQASRLINTQLAAGLFTLPGEPPGSDSLALRNLQRGWRMGLPSGRRVATAMGVPDPLTAEELALDGPAPLWFYVLKEAELREGGQRLGPVGGRIVAEVLLGLLDGDPLSYLSVEPAFAPHLPDSDGDGKFTLPDLIKFAFGQVDDPPPPPGGWGN